jgi:hypothetical protein
MSDEDLDFSADEWAKIPDQKKVRICRLLASQARQMAIVDDGGQCRTYLRIAAEWDRLAADFEQVAAE